MLFFFFSAGVLGVSPVVDDDGLSFLSVTVNVSLIVVVVGIILELEGFVIVAVIVVVIVAAFDVVVVFEIVTDVAFESSLEEGAL